MKIICSDGRELASALFKPKGELKGAIMIAPATGIKKDFYRPFAEHLSSQGYGVLTFDFRGIGGSKAGPLKKDTTSIEDWGRKDLSAVLSTLAEHFPETSYHLIGHSAGGQLSGLMENAHKLTSQFNFAGSTGKLSNMKMSFWIKAQFFMNFFIPLNNLIFGYTNCQWVGMGEPLPKKVAYQWGLWCKNDGYIKEALGKTIVNHKYDQLSYPIMWVNAADDPIANNINVDEIIKIHPNMSNHKIHIKPKEYGLKEVGHMKFFSRSNKKLWTLALDWLDQF